MMKITVTINLGNYENVKIESNDYPNAEMCVRELYSVVRLIPGEPAFRFKEFLYKWVENIEHG